MPISFLMKLLQSLNVLVVDDEQDLREAMADYFKMSGANTFCAEDGLVAQKILKSEKIDVVFTDMRMPNCDGMGLIQAINKMQNRPEVFVCSGAHDLTEEHLKSLGVLRIFNKPFDARELVNAILALKSKLSS
jgi:DNA-binding NtrC family response regulator